MLALTVTILFRVLQACLHYFSAQLRMYSSVLVSLRHKLLITYTALYSITQYLLNFREFAFSLMAVTETVILRDMVATQWWQQLFPMCLFWTGNTDYNLNLNSSCTSVPQKYKKGTKTLVKNLLFSVYYR